MTKLYVLIPDVSSGNAFNAVLREHGISTEFEYQLIHPRVVNNKLSTSPEVVQDLNNIFKTFTDHTRSVVIACNTLQLWLDKINPEYRKNVKIYTTFEACNWKYRTKKTKPVWLGTTPLVERTKDFPTFVSLGRPEVQDLVQELIWRLKMLYGDDIQTAPESVKKDIGNRDLQISTIADIKDQIVKALIKLNIKNVIVGCTELPMTFTKRESGINFIDPAQILAEYVKAQSVTVLFAGGTISSLADAEGKRYPGKVFDLVEKLISKKEGSLTRVNVTKAEIVYSGLSENMTIVDHKRICAEVKKLINSGVYRVVITHGTDSMEQMARYLDENLGSFLKEKNANVVMTGANRSPECDSADAWDNLHYAINTRIGSLHPGVYVAFNRKIVEAKNVIKDFFVHDIMNFVDRQSNAYLSTKRQFHKLVSKQNKLLDKKLNILTEDNSVVIPYDVNVIRSDHVDLLKTIELVKPKAVLFKLYHSGTANTSDPDASVASLIKKLRDSDIVCFGATENGEPTDLHLYETSVALLNAGLVPLYNMIFPVALHKLSLVVNSVGSKEKLINGMLNNLIGEIDESLINIRDIGMLKSLYSSDF